MRTVCGICLEEFNESACSVALFRCGHVFDALCIDQFLELGSKCPTCSRIIDKTKKNNYIRIYMFDGGDSSESSVHNGSRKSLAAPNHQVIALQNELLNTKTKLDETRTEHENVLVQIRNKENILAANLKIMKKLRAEHQQATNSRNSNQIELNSIKLCNHSLINELKQSQESYKAIDRELASCRSKKDKCSTCENKTFNHKNNMRVAPDSSFQQENQNFETKYLDLQKLHADLLNKEQILEKKYVELTVKMNNSSLMTDNQQMEKQLVDSKSKERNLTTDLSRMRQSKDRIYKEKRSFQEKFDAANTQLNEIRVSKEAWLDEIKVLKEKLGVSEENVKRLQEKIKTSDDTIGLLQGKLRVSEENVKRLLAKIKTSDDTIALLQGKLRVSEENVKRLQETRQTYITQNLVLHEKVLASEQMVQAFQENELAISKELDTTNLECGRFKRTNDDLVTENVALKEKLKSASRPWFS